MPTKKTLGNLVLSRTAGESIRIGDDVVIEVVKIERDKVRLGIRAPKDLAIVRDNAKKTTAAGVK